MKRRTILYFVILILSFLFLYLSDTFWIEDSLFSTTLIQSAYQIIGALMFTLAMYDVGYHFFRFKKRVFLQSMIVIIPGLVIAINNFPISAYFNHRFVMTQTHSVLYLYLIESFSTAFFEEVIYRGILLFLILQKLANTKEGVFKAILISSAIFALSHLLNLLSGASFANTLLQVGYSFLMGMMWAVVFIKTRNLAYPILLHATYNYFGFVLFKAGTVMNRYDSITVILTTILALFAIVYYYYQYTTIKKEDVYYFSNPHK